jgi:uncharacterized protein YceK
MKIIAILLAATLLTGCGSLAAVGVAQENTADVRRAAAAVRHQAFCNQAAAAALERYRSNEDRAAFIRLCDTVSAH